MYREQGDSSAPLVVYRLTCRVSFGPPLVVYRLACRSFGSPLVVYRLACRLGHGVVWCGVVWSVYVRVCVCG